MGSSRLVFRSAVLSFGCLPLLTAAAPAQERAAVERTLPTTIARAVPARVSSGMASRLGATDSNRVLQLSINLPLRNQDQLNALLADLYNPASPRFHKYLSPREFDLSFGPAQADYEALVTWAGNNGFTIKSRTANLRILNVEGTVYTINRALHLALTDYRDTEQNRSFYAPDREPALDLPVSILGIDGLDDADPPHRHYRKGNAAEIARTANAIAGSGPASQYLPSDMRAAYYGHGPLTGLGQTVGIFSFDGYHANDLPLYYSQTGMSTSVPVSNVLVNGFSGNCVLNSPCDDGEQILDIVQVQGMAPGLSGILFYESNATANPILNQMVMDNEAKIISSSWGGGGFGTSSDTYFEQMAAQGQTYLNATGDDGAFNRYTYDAPSVDPYIVQVGGTDLVTSGAGGAWSSETGWVYSGGGFYAAGAEAIPAWQAASITSANGGSTTYRNSPDLAAEADFDNPTVVNGLFDIGYGGTSFATPRLAGYLALANEQSIANGLGTLGFVNQNLYTLGRNDDTVAYHDITSGSNPADEYAGTQASFNAVAGYDLVTGWGSPNGPALINALAGTAYQDFALTGTTASLATTRNGSVSDKLTITGANGFAGVVNLSTSALPKGVTASFSPASATTSSTVTFAADNTVPFSTLTVTVTGTSGALTHSVVYTLQINKQAGRDFTIGASGGITAAIGSSSGNTVTVTENQLPAPVNLSVSGLPAGVTATFPSEVNSGSFAFTLNASSSAVPGTFNVMVTGTYPTTTLTHAVTFPLTVVLPGKQLLGNPGFENGTSATPWTLTSSNGQTTYLLCTLAACGVGAHSGNYYLYFDGYGMTHTDAATQTVSIPSNVSSATLSFYLTETTDETTTTKANDVLTVKILNSSGTVLSTVATFSNLDARSTTGYRLYQYALPSSVIGQTVVVSFSGTENTSLQTSFFLDDVSLNVQ